MGIDPTAVSAWTEIGGVELMRVKRERERRWAYALLLARGQK